MPVVLVASVLVLAALARPPAAAAATTENAAGRYDSLVLRDLGGKTAALVQLVAADGVFTPVELWRSKKGAFDVSKAAFVAGDVNGDGIGDGIVLYDLGQRALAPAGLPQRRTARAADHRLDVADGCVRQVARDASPSAT